MAKGKEKVFGDPRNDDAYKEREAEREKLKQEREERERKMFRPDLPTPFYDARCLGWAKTPRGWVAVAFTLHEGRVVDPELLTEPSSKPVVARELQLELHRRLVVTDPKASA